MPNVGSCTQFSFVARLPLALIYGIALNVGEGLSEAKQISLQIACSKIKRVWVSYSAKGRDPFEVASAVADAAEDLKIGVGVLSPYIYGEQEIRGRIEELVGNYGQRFDLCVGLGDRNLLRELGVDVVHKDFLIKLRSLCKALKEHLNKKAVRIWLGAQGSNTLSLAECFDGVLLNHSNPEAIKWALNVVGSVRRSRLVGVSAPAYIYKDVESDMLNAAKKAALKILLGSSRRLAKDLGIDSEYQQVLRKVRSIHLGEEASIVSEDLVRTLTITMHVDMLPRYIQKLEELGVDEVVFGYPLSTSVEHVRLLKSALDSLP